MIAEVRGLGKDFRKLRAVDSLDLSVQAKEIVGLLGPNGAGKTTTISMIGGVLAKSRGTVVIGGKDLEVHPFAAKRQLGLVPQELALYLDLTGQENLTFFASLYADPDGDRDERIDWALELVGLTDRKCDRVATYSGGMQRRLNLAAGLVHKPRLLILDEPTVGVDPQSRKHIFDSIKRLRSEEGVSVLYTSHYMEEVEALCDRVVIMDGGKLVAEGRIDELVRQHAAPILAIELGDDADADAALATANQRLGAKKACLEGRHLEVVIDGDFGPLVSEIEKAAGSITALRTREANLESVFLGLTGHSLRD